jgi:regulator of protease activity HflC (stomatin/prohibitin superfamily)
MNIAEFVGLFSGAAWLAFFAVLAAFGVRASRNQPAKGLGTVLVIVLVAAIGLSVVSAGLVFVAPEERGVVLSAFSEGGVRQEAIQPGLRWVIPFAETVKVYSISRQTYTMSTVGGEGQIVGDDSIQARTSDGQIVYIDASVIYQVNAAEVIPLHINWQGRYEDGVVRPQSRGAIRDSVSQFGVEELVSSKRAEMEVMITSTLEKSLASNNLVLVDFVLRNVRFSDEYAAAVEQKQVAEQQAQQAKFVVEQRRQEAEQARQVAQGSADAAVIAAQGAAQARLIEAEAEAKALDLIANALAENPNLLTYQYITKLAPNIQVMLVPNDNPYLLPLPNLPAQSITTVE